MSRVRGRGKDYVRTTNRDAEISHVAIACFPLLSPEEMAAECTGNDSTCSGCDGYGGEEASAKAVDYSPDHRHGHQPIELYQHAI